jgi:hypothetical protein
MVIQELLHTAARRVPIVGIGRSRGGLQNYYPPCPTAQDGIFAGAALDPAHESGLAEFLGQAHLSQVFSNLLKFIATKYTDESG